MKKLQEILVLTYHSYPFLPSFLGGIPTPEKSEIARQIGIIIPTLGEVIKFIYPLVNFHITMENHHFSWVNPLFLWPWLQ
jgi:hypothetical protein